MCAHGPGKRGSPRQDLWTFGQFATHVGLRTHTRRVPADPSARIRNELISNCPTVQKLNNRQQTRHPKPSDLAELSGLHWTLRPRKVPSTFQSTPQCSRTPRTRTHHTHSTRRHRTPCYPHWTVY